MTILINYNELETIKNLKFKKIIFTTNINNYDKNKINNNFKQKDWDYFYIYGNTKNDPRKLARTIKIKIHEYINCDFSIWHDSSFELIKLPLEWVEIKENLGLFRHRFNKSLSEELNGCLLANKDLKHKLKSQVKFYLSKKFPDNFFLPETGILVRKHPKINEFCNLWHNEILNWSKRDQLSIGYILFNTNTKYEILGENIIDNKYFKFNNHEKLGRKIGKNTIYYL